MSELKAHSIIGLDGRCNRVDNDYYLKSEADKYIQELEEKYFKDLQDAEDSFKSILELDCKEIRHHKYKRCLDKAELAIKDDYLPWNMKWHERWLKLAEKFKETK